MAPYNGSAVAEHAATNSKTRIPVRWPMSSQTISARGKIKWSTPSSGHLNCNRRGVLRPQGAVQDRGIVDEVREGHGQHLRQLHGCQHPSR